MKILVTGGTGRIGANLVLRLLDAGHSIRSFVYPGDASRARKLDAYDGVETVYGDLRNSDDVGKAVAGVDAIYHLAAAFQGPFDNRQYLDINAMGTLNLLESVREHCPNLHSLCLRQHRRASIWTRASMVAIRLFPIPKTRESSIPIWVI